MHRILKRMLDAGRKRQPLQMLRLVIFLISIPLLAHGLETDKNAKIYIIADSTTYNYKTGIKTFTGHVKVDQGSTHLIADKLVTKNNNQHKIHEVIAYGLEQLAHYWTVPKPGEKELHANAKIIKLYPATATITLEEKVVVKQGENSFQGQVILYNMNDQTITVPASKNGRAVLVYNPDK